MKSIILLITIMTLSVPLALSGSIQERNLLLFSYQKGIKLSDKEFEARIKQKIEPQYPSGCSFKGKVGATLTVNKIGKVIKISYQEGHPIFRIYINKAVKKWRFKPLLKEGKPIEFSGNIAYIYQ